MKRWELSILIGLVLSVFACNVTGFAEQCGEVRAESIRLHILANSDSEEDQALKLKVRDAVLAEVGVTLSGASGKAEAVRIARENIPRVEETARETLRANGCGDDVRAQVVNMYFATRRYGNVVMPAGHYDAVRIIIGTGAGHNWWCVMFPPLCLPAAEQKGGDAAISAEEVLIPDQPEFQVKLAVVEAFESARELLAGWMKK